MADRGKERDGRPPVPVPDEFEVTPVHFHVWDGAHGPGRWLLFCGLSLAHKLEPDKPPIVFPICELGSVALLDVRAEFAARRSRLLAAVDVT